MDINKLVVRIMLVYFGLMIVIPLLSRYSYALEYVDFSPWDYQKLTDIDAEMVLIDDPMEGSKVLVTERVTFDVHQVSKNDLCYELWLDLPEQVVDGLTLDYTVLSVKEVLPDGSLKEYQKSYFLSTNGNDGGYNSNTWYHSKGPYRKARDQYECVFIYVDGIYRDQVTYEITYEMNNVALRYYDCSDLYLSLYSESPIKDLKSYKAEILIPDEEMPSYGNFEYYTYGTDNNGFDVEESSTKNPGYYTFSIDLDEEDLSFKPYNLYLEFELVAYNEDKHIFVENARYNDYSFDYALDEIREDYHTEHFKPESYISIKVIIFALGIFGACVVIVEALNKKKAILSQHIFYEPTETIDYYEDIPSDLDPNFAAALVFSKGKPPKDNSGIYSALLLSIARKGYITFDNYGANDAKITIVNNPNDGMSNSIMPMEPLTESETLYYNLLVRHTQNKSILMSVFQRRIAVDYENTATFYDKINEAIVNTGVNEGYVQKADFTKIKDELLHSSKKNFSKAIIFIIILNIFFFHTHVDFAYGGFFIYGFACLFSSIYLKNLEYKSVLLTQFGVNEYEKWKGFYNYLKTDKFLSGSNIMNMPMRERLFIYAVAFGIPTKVTEVIGIDDSNVSYSGTQSYILSNPYIHSGRIHVSSRGVSRAVRSGARFHKASTRSRGYTGGGRSFGSYGGGGS